MPRVRRGSCVLGAVVWLAACAPTEQALRRQIDRANTCEQDSDCVDLGPVCPVGCVNLVHVDEAEPLADKLAAFEAADDTECAYRCPVVISIRCEEETCVYEAALPEE